MSSTSILLSGFIPREPEEISAEWLFEVINQYRGVKDLSLVRHPDDLTNCEIVERKTSHAYTSSTYIITVHFKCFTSMGLEQCKYSFFLKLLPSATISGCDPGFKLAKAANYFQREIEAHFRILSHLKTIWSDSSKTNFGQPGGRAWTSIEITTPEIVYGSYNESGDGVIVLQDVTQDPAPFNPVDHYRGLTLNQAMCTVEHLSAIHASATAALIKGQTDERFEHLLNDSREQSRIESISNEMSQLLRLFGRFLRVVPGYREQSDHFEKYRSTMVMMLMRSLKRPTDFPLRTTIHGELWDRNLLFRKKSSKSAYINPHELEVLKVDFEPHDENGHKDGGGDTEEFIDLEVMFTDWKNMAMASPANDLAFLLFTSTNRSIREQHGRQILEKYYLCFTECLRTKYDINVSKLYPEFDFDAFLKDFDNCHFTGFLQAACLMTRELRHLESEFAYVNAEKLMEKAKAGEDLRDLGRRLIELADEFVPQIGSPEWKKILAQNSNVVVIKA